MRPEEVVAGDSHVRIANTTSLVERGVVLLDERIVRDSTQRGTGVDVRHSLSEEWQTYGSTLPEHDEAFAAYFDIVDLSCLPLSRTFAYSLLDNQAEVSLRA